MAGETQSGPMLHEPVLRSAVEVKGVLAELLSSAKHPSPKQGQIHLYARVHSGAEAMVWILLCDDNGMLLFALRVALTHETRNIPQAFCYWAKVLGDMGFKSISPMPQRVLHELEQRQWV